MSMVDLFGGPRYLFVNVNTFPANAFTLSCWVRLSGAGMVFFYGNRDQTSDSRLTSMQVRIDTQIEVAFVDASVSVRTSLAQPLTNDEHHVAVTFKQSPGSESATVGIYVDGVAIQEAAVTLLNQESVRQSKSLPVSSTLYVATNPPNDPDTNNPIRASDVFPGDVSDYRIWSRVLTSSEILQDAIASVTGTEPGLYLALPLNDAHLDRATSQALDVSPAKRNASSAVILADVRYIAYESSFNFPTGSRTVEMWLRCGAADDQILLSYGDVSSSDHPNDGGVPWILSNTGSLAINGQSTGAGVADGHWHHVAVVVNEADNSDTIYVDGVRSYSGPRIDSGQKANQVFVLGAGEQDTGTSDSVFTGEMNAIAIWSSARTADQVQEDMAWMPPMDDGTLVAQYLPFAQYRAKADDPLLTELPKHALTVAADADIRTTAPVTINFKAAERSYVVRFAARTPGNLLRHTLQAANNSPLKTGLSLYCTADGRIHLNEFDNVHETRPELQSASYDSVDIRGLGIDILDGHRHTAAYVFDGDTVRLYVDGLDVTQTSANTEQTRWPDDDSLAGYVKLGGTAPDANGAAFAGDFYCLGVWNRALDVHEVEQAGVGIMTGLSEDRVGYWPFNNDGKALESDVAAFGASQPLVFSPSVHSAAHTSQELAHAICRVIGIPHDPPLEATRLTSSHTIHVPSGAAYLYGGLTSRASDDTTYSGYPISIRVFDPAGQELTSSTASTLVITNRPDGGLRALVVQAPQAGTWRIEVSANSQADFAFQLQAIPAQNAVGAMTRHLVQIYNGPPPTSNASIATRDSSASDWPWVEVIAAGALAGVLTVLSLGTLTPLTIGLAGVVSVATSAQVLAASRSRKQTAKILFNTGGRRIGVLVLDSNTKDDQAANAIYRGRKEFLYQGILDQLDRRHFELHTLVEQNNTRTKVESHLVNPDIRYVTASGHGLDHAYLGWGNKEVLMASWLNASMVQDKIFHIVACRTGKDLGPKIIQLGGKAFLGYKDRYGISALDTTSGAQWVETDNGRQLASATVSAAVAIDRVILAGGTAQEAFDAARAAYDAVKIKMEQDKMPLKFIWRLEANRDLLVLLGDPQARLYTP